MIRSIYSVMFYLVLPGIYLRVFWRSLKEPRYKADLQQRMGRVPTMNPGHIWVHAVSAGETIASREIVERLLEEGHKVLITNMTPAGRDRVSALFGSRVSNVYVPYDLPHAVNRFLDRVKPAALIIIDTELWPNMIAKTKAQGVPVYLVNGRLSDKSASGYGKIRGLTAPMFAGITKVFSQTESQTSRFLDLGAKDVTTTGSVKFDAVLPEDFDERVGQLKAAFGSRRCLVGASTHEGEETALLAAYQQLKIDDGLLILAPRHNHRSSVVVDHIKAAGFQFQKHSDGGTLQSSTQVYLLDTMGELIYFYGICEVAFVGGSLVDVGGHNPMEPASLGKPTMMGPYRRNIADIAEQFTSAGAMKSVQSPADIHEVWRALLSDQTTVKEMSEAAYEVMKMNRGAAERVLVEILKNLEKQGVS